MEAEMGEAMQAAIAQFLSVCPEATADIAQELISSHGDVGAALEAYFGQGETAATPAQPAVPAASAPNQSQPSLAANAAAAAASKRSRVTTFSELASSDDKDDENQQDFYAGGEKSGVAIRGPKKDARKQFFDSARSSDAVETDEERHMHEASSGRRMFAGQGHKLGDSEAPSQVIGEPVAAPPQIRTVTITFWREGFTIDDGEETPTLRRLDDPNNKAFLEAVGNGHVPDELRKYGAEMRVSLVDNHDQEFVAPKRRIKAFEGSGHRLGSVAPEAVSSATTATTSASSTAAAAAAPAPTNVVNPDLPQTRLQIRLADSTRLVARFNLTQTVAELRKFIDSARPGTGPNYTLMTMHDKKEVTDETLTLEAAGLKNAVVVQKPIK